MNSTLITFMKQFKSVAVALAVYLSGCASSDKISSIKEPEATRILRTLSADDMQGRASFTPGIEKAANFIAREFQKIGIRPMPGSTDFKQTFTVYRVTPQQTEVSLNGSTLAPEHIFATSSQEELQWKTGDDRTIVTIAENDNFRDAMSKLNSLESDALILVHPKHATTFANYQRFTRRGSILQEIGTGPSRVFILTGQDQVQDYQVRVQNKTEKLSLTNVAGMIEGNRKDEFVVFSGHYDHIGIRPAVNGDSIANGADDDASGVTAMMMLADYYEKQNKPERSIIFIAFTAEEIGGYGSRYFSQQLNPDQIVAMFNIEMVGKPSKFGPNSAYLTGFERSDLGKLMQKRLEGTTYSIHPDPYPNQNLFYRSDNATLARLGVPAHTISSVQIDEDKTYHTVDDEFEILDMPHFTSMIRAIALASKGVVNGEDTPMRVDKSQVR